MDKKFFFQIIALLIVIFGALVVTTNSQLLNLFLPPESVTSSPNPSASSAPLNLRRVRIIDAASLPGFENIKVRLNIEVADTSQSRARWLGGRTSLASDSGMLFIFDKADQHKFWMKGK